MLENIDGDDVLFYVPKLDNSVDYTWGYSHETIVDLLLLREFLEGKFHAQIE
jgi:hypothetical protein